MSEWRERYSIIYKKVKAYCSISDAAIADAVNVSIDAVRQYSSKRATMPSDFDALGKLFETEIGKLSNNNKTRLFNEIQKLLKINPSRIRCDKIGEAIYDMLKECYSNEKSKILNSNVSQNYYKPTGHTQAIIFDFDGTLTKTKSRTTWESLWEMLGYDVNECRNLHRQYDQGNFSHQEWCDKTAQKFIEKGLTRKQVLSLAKRIKLISGCKETLKIIQNRDIKLYIVSGSIKEIIENVLGSAHSFFSDIKANEFVFNRQTSILKKIIGTKFDFEGKASYIEHIADELEIATSDILFVGNSNNDVWAYQSGARTLCVNPVGTDYHDNTVWHETIVECKDLSEILPFIR